MSPIAPIALKRVASRLSLATAPIILPQAKFVRNRVPRLPEAAGPRSGHVGHGGVPLRLAVLGESTAVGVGIAHLADGVPAQVAAEVAALTGTQVIWRAIGRGHGMTVRRALDAFVATEPERFDGAVVLLGVNDVFRFTRLSEWNSAVTALAAELRSRGCRFVVFSALPPIGKFPALPWPLRAVLGLRGRLLDAQLERLSRVAGLFGYCPIRFGSEAAHVASDGVHPSVAGYALWANQLARNCAAHCDPAIAST